MKIAFDFPFRFLQLLKLNQFSDIVKSTGSLQLDQDETGNLIQIKDCRDASYAICRV